MAALAASPGTPALLQLQLEMSRDVRAKRLSLRIAAVLRGWLVVGLVTAICFRLEASEAFAGFVLLSAVLLTCLDCRIQEAALVSAAAVLALDCFFIEPRFSLAVARAVDLAALVAFGTSTLITTGLASRARHAGRRADRERRKLERLYDLSQRLLAMNPASATHEDVAEAARTALELDAVSIFDAASARSHNAGRSAHNLEERTRNAYLAKRNEDARDEKVSVRYLLTGGRNLGAAGLEGSEDASEITGPAVAMITATLLRHEAARGAALAEAEARTEMLRAAILDALAHEFKTPLATILTAAGGMRASGPLQPDQEELAEIVENETERLSGLSSRLLRLARLDSKEVKPLLEPVEVDSLVEEAVERQLRYSPDRHISVASGRNDVVAADGELLQLALGQLMDNACRYSPPGTTIAVSVEAVDRLVNIRIWNGGESIEAAEREQIFDRLYRGRTGRRLSGGTGLGLYVARKIALAHGGGLELESPRPGKGGVSFRLWLPLVRGGEALVEGQSQSADRG